ncbi:MAG: hypothetical protein ACTHK6_11000 [Solirubrobacterales bacterium]
MSGTQDDQVASICLRQMRQVIVLPRAGDDYLCPGGLREHLPERQSLVSLLAVEVADEDSTKRHRVSQVFGMLGR